MTEVEIGAMQLQAKEPQDCQSPPEARKRQERTLSESERGQGPANALISSF